MRVNVWFACLHFSMWCLQNLPSENFKLYTKSFYCCCCYRFGSRHTPFELIWSFSLVTLWVQTNCVDGARKYSRMWNTYQSICIARIPFYPEFVYCCLTDGIKSFKNLPKAHKTLEPYTNWCTHTQSSLYVSQMLDSRIPIPFAHIVFFFFFDYPTISFVFLVVTVCVWIAMTS